MHHGDFIRAKLLSTKDHTTTYLNTARVMEQQLRTCTALGEGTNSVPSTHTMGFKSTVTLSPLDPVPPSWPLQAPFTHMMHMPLHRY